MNVTNCNFTGVKWDKKATRAIEITAMALLNITELFKAQSITIETLLKIESPERKEAPCDKKRK